MQVRPLSALTRVEIQELAHAAADRGEPLPDANPYDPAVDLARHAVFETAHASRFAALRPAHLNERTHFANQGCTS